MNLTQLAGYLETSKEYLAYLLSILDGTQDYYTDEDLQDAEVIADLLLETEESEP